MTGNAIFSSSGFPSWSFATSPSMTEAATISPIFIGGPSRPCPDIRGTRSSCDLRPREPVEDRPHVEAHPEGHLDHALLVHRLELANGHRHAMRLDQRPRISDGDEALRIRGELSERLVRPIAERPEVHPEPLPRSRMQPDVIDVPIEESLLQRLGGLRRAGVRERVVRQTVLASSHEFLVRQRVTERVKLAVLGDPDEEVPSLLAHLDESFHDGGLFRELGQRGVRLYDSALEVVREVTRRLT